MLVNALRHLGIHRQLAGGRESGEVCTRHTHNHALHLSLSECHKLGTQPKEIQVFVGLEHVFVSMRGKGKRTYYGSKVEDFRSLKYSHSKHLFDQHVVHDLLTEDMHKQYGHKYIYIF